MNNQPIYVCENCGIILKTTIIKKKLNKNLCNICFKIKKYKYAKSVKKNSK
jgi:hypothetical protein